MDDFAGKPFIAPEMTGINPREHFRSMFIDQMRMFAKTIDEHPSGQMIIAMLTPYLSMFGAANLIENISSSNSLVDILNDAADVVEKSDDSSSGVVFGFHSSESLSLIAFNFENGSAGSKKIPMKKDSTLAGQMFFEESVKRELSSAAKELNMTQLVKTTMTLCGV